MSTPSTRSNGKNENSITNVELTRAHNSTRVTPDIVASAISVLFTWEVTLTECPRKCCGQMIIIYTQPVTKYWHYLCVWSTNENFECTFDPRISFFSHQHHHVACQLTMVIIHCHRRYQQQSVLNSQLRRDTDSNKPRMVGHSFQIQPQLKSRDFISYHTRLCQLPLLGHRQPSPPLSPTPEHCCLYPMSVIVVYVTTNNLRWRNFSRAHLSPWPG